jgi:hypothetical protein
VPIVKIISGGQTGADRGGLEAALYCGIPHGGWCPRGRKAEDGRIPDKYVLNEMRSADYLARTKANVVDSDATLVFTMRTPTGGSLRTIEFAHAGEKPWHNIDLSLETRERAAKQIVTWLNGETAFDYDEYVARPPRDCVLNIAGSRESKADGIMDAVTAIMVDVITATNPECKCFYPLS